MKDKVSLRIRIAWGRRRAADGGPAPPLPPSPQPLETDDSSPPYHPYPFYYVYNSQEESLQAAAERKKDLPLEVPSHPKDKR